MSKDLGCKWNFIVRNEASQEQGREDLSFDYFKEKERCLVREYIQNSMDAHSSQNGVPYVIVEFSFGELLCSDYPELIQSLPERLKACSEYCQGDNAKDPYAEKYEYLVDHINGSIGYLKVSDYNTKGMPYDFDKFKKSKFKACVRSANSSHKDSCNAGGSHGKGKTVGFVNSNINAVYYSTMTEDGNRYGEGVIKLCDHIFFDENGQKQIFEDVAFYDSQLGKNPDTDNIPDVFRRDKVGTDAYVLGIEKTEEYVKKLKKEVLRSFFKAIKEDLLKVIVCGEKITSENISNKLLEYFEEEGELDNVRTRTPELAFNPRPYYTEVLCKAGLDDDHRVFDTERDFPGEFKTLGRTLVYTWKSSCITQGRDSIVYMRNNNMVIEVKRGRKNGGYYAVFVCIGEGSETLRHMENVTHDKWDSAEVTKENRAKAKKILAEKKLLIEKCERMMFPEEEGKEKVIKSLKSRRISSLGNNQADEEESMWPSSNVTDGEMNASRYGDTSSILETIDGKRKKKKAKGKSATDENNPGPSITPVAKRIDEKTVPKYEFVDAKIIVLLQRVTSSIGNIISDAIGKAIYTVSADGSIEPQKVNVIVKALGFADVVMEYQLEQKIEKGCTLTLVIDSVIMIPVEDQSTKIDLPPKEGIPMTPDTSTVEDEGEREGNTDAVQKYGVRLREIKIDGAHRHLIPLRDGEFACKLVLNVAREFKDCKLELFVQGVSGKMPLKIKHVSTGCQMGGIFENEIYGFNLFPGNNVIKFTPSESVKIYTLIVKAYGN